MKEIIGDDYPTYEDSVNATLAEKQQEGAYTYLKEVEDKIHKENLERLLQENLELRHRLACIADDIEIIDDHIFSHKKSRKRFRKPSVTSDGDIISDRAWYHVTNIQIACDLNDDSPLEWMADSELDNLNRDLGEDPVFQGHLQHMKSADEYSSKYKGKK
jgi:hypothetical protein